MALLLKNNAVFLHVPKTGGIWVGRVLKQLELVKAELGRPHQNFERYFWYDRFHRDEKVFRNLLRRQVGLLPRVDPKCFKFCFVREPLSWYESWWRYAGSRGWRRFGDEDNPYHWSPVAMLNGLGSPDFNTFMANVNRERPGFVTELFGSYVHPSTTFVGKQENLAQDLIKALSLAGLPVDPREVEKVPAANESPTNGAGVEWDPKVKRETLRLEYAAYVRHGYPLPLVE